MWRSLTEKKKKEIKQQASQRWWKSSYLAFLAQVPEMPVWSSRDVRMPDLRNGLLPLLPAPSSNHAHGSAQKVGNSEPEEASQESEGEYKRRENKVHTPKKWGTSVFYSWIPYSEICKGPVNIGSLGQSSLWEKSRTQLFHLCLNSSAYMDLIILQDNLLS